MTKYLERMYLGLENQTYCGFPIGVFLEIMKVAKGIGMIN